MKILLTGNMGYIGPLVVQRLRVSYPDAILVGFDIGYFGNCVTGTEILPECRVNLQYFADIRKFPEEVLNGVDAIVHLAGLSNDSTGNWFEDLTLDINYRASIELARKAKAAGVKSFVFASSCSIYGTAEDSLRTEKSSLNPLTPYAISKAFTERDLEPLASEQFKITCLRFPTACGWSDRLRLDLVLNDFVAEAVASRRISILSDGTLWRALINVKDMARAIDWAVTRDVSNGGEFLAVNIGSDGWNYKLKDLAEVVAEVIPDIDISVNKDAQPDKRSYRVNFDYFNKLAPLYQPIVGLIESIKELKDGLEAIGFNDGDFRNCKYMRLNVLTEFQKRGLLNEKLQWIKDS